MNRIKFNLTQKIIILFSLVLIPFLVCAGIIVQNLFEGQVISNANAAIASFTYYQGQDIEEHFKKIEALGRRSVEFIKKKLNRTIRPEEYDRFDSRYRYIQGALRTDIDAFPDTDRSAVFLSNRTLPDDRIKRIILATEEGFDDYARGVLATVFNMYLITRDQLIRIYEKDWALQIEADHDFRNDLFYYAADPEHSPDRTARWTETYYDSIWKHWMTSLITPIYIHDEFVGIIGHDVILDDLYEDILKKRFYESGYGFIFDDKGNIVVHPHHLDKLLKTARMGEKLDRTRLDDPELIRAVTHVISSGAGSNPLASYPFSSNGTRNHFHAYKLNTMNWYFGTIIPEKEVVQMLPRFRSDFVKGAAVFGLCLFLTLLLLVWVYVVSPVREVSKATEKIGEGNLDYQISYASGDELGRLARSFNTMTSNLKEITASRDQLDREFRFRKEAEEKLRKYQELLEERIRERTAELRRLRNLLSNIVDSMPSVLIGVDCDGSIMQWNRQAEVVTGVPAAHALGRTLEEAFPELAGQMEKVWTAIEENSPQKEVKIAAVIQGENRYYDITVYPLVEERVIGAVIRVDDVTERVRIDEVIIQSEKMMSVGGLAAGMAHEINNPLAGILQNMQMIKSRFSPDLLANRHSAHACGTTMEALEAFIKERKIDEMMTLVIESGIRAAQIVENMLGFSRKSTSTFVPYDPVDLMEKTLDLASNDYDLKTKFDFRQIEIVREFDPMLPSIRCEGTQIQQVFLNLLKNGAHAMAEKSRDGYTPCFTLRMSREEDRIRIEVEDNGPGMNDDTKKRIFEPFFTTKTVGLGTGLGLSVSYFIITESHGGSMKVESSPGQGTRFIIHLPLEPAHAMLQSI